MNNDRRFILTKDKKHIQEIAFYWNRLDIIEQANSREIKLTDNEIDTILTELVENHNCEYGVTWDTIDACIDEVLEDRKKKDSIIRGE